MFGHELMKPMLPIFLSNLVETKQNNLIVEAIKFGVSTHITNSHTTKHNVARSFWAPWSPLPWSLVRTQVPKWRQKILGFQGNVFIEVYNDVFKLKMVHWTFGLT